MSHRAQLVWRPEPDLIEVVRVLLLLQAGFAVLSTVEVAFLAALTGTAAVLAPTFVLTVCAAALFLALSAGLRRRSYFVRRVVVIVEVLVVLGALVELVLSLVLGGLLELVPVLTRVVLPVAVIVLLRRSRRRVPRDEDAFANAPLGAVA